MIQFLVKRLPFYYGWVVVAAAFLTMALVVNARTGFSLLLPPILNEFSWDRSLTAGAFSFGFVVSALGSPLLGYLMDRKGPVLVGCLGILSTSAGLWLATFTSAAWHLYLSLGVLVGVGSVCLGYSGQSLYLPNWFVRRRGLAIGIAFSGVGVGAMVLLPWMQTLVDKSGWRAACGLLSIIVLVLGLPSVMLLRRAPQDIGLAPDGDPVLDCAGTAKAASSNVVDAQWVAIEWTLARAVRTARFWWLALSYFCMMYSWYAVQVHQTKYLLEVGYSAAQSAWALGAVSLAGIPGGILLGHLSDRIGREIVFAISCIGFVITYLLLLVAGTAGTAGAGAGLVLLYALIIAQGVLGYGSTAVFGAIPAEIFAGKHFGSVFGTLMLLAICGGAVGPWLTGLLYDRSGNYVLAFYLAIACSALAIFAMYRAAPGKVRAVAGRIKGAA